MCTTGQKSSLKKKSILVTFSNPPQSKEIAAFLWNRSLIPFGNVGNFLSDPGSVRMRSFPILTSPPIVRKGKRWTGGVGAKGKWKRGAVGKCSDPFSLFPPFFPTFPLFFSLFSFSPSFPYGKANVFGIRFRNEQRSHLPIVCWDRLTTPPTPSLFVNVPFDSRTGSKSRFLNGIFSKSSLWEVSVLVICAGIRNG